MAKILVSGSIAYDRIMNFSGLFSEHLMPDKLHTINLSFHVEKMSVEFGGCAGNVAYSLALLGEQPVIIASAGSDFNDYHAHLLRSGVDPASIHVLQSRLTASAYILTDRADNQIAAFHGGAGDEGYDVPVETANRSFAIIAPGCLPDMKALPAHYRAHQVPYFFDPSQQLPALSDEALIDGITGAAALFASDYEFELIRRRLNWHEADILERTPVIVVTHGEKGSYVVTKDGSTHVPAHAVKNVVDPTGAGDAYRAGYLKGSVLELLPVQCARLGSIAASFAVEAYGTQNHRFTKEEFTARYKKTYGEGIEL